MIWEKPKKKTDYLKTKQKRPWLFENKYCKLVERRGLLFVLKTFF